MLVSLCVLQTRLEQQKETTLQKIRELKVSTSEQDTPAYVPTRQASTESLLSTPEHTSREGTLFTPSADKELEAILNRVEAASEPSGDSATKSRPVTGETVTSGTYTSPSSALSKPSIPDEDSQETDRQLQSATQLAPQAMTPLAKSRLGMVTPSISVADLKPSVSQLSLQLSGRRTVMSRETLCEREKLDQHVNMTYQGLTARYHEMLSEINKIDHGLNVGVPPKFLTIPGDKVVQKAPEVPEPSREERGRPESGGTATVTLSDQESGNAEQLDVEPQEEDGLVAVSLEVPITEQADQSGNALVYSSEEDGQSASTEYPSLGDDVAPSYIDESVCDHDVAASMYGESTTYQTGLASEYEQSVLSDNELDNESTLD